MEEHLEPTSELTLDVVKERAIKGVAALTTRTFLLQAVALIGTFFLTVLLTPAEYGVFFLVSAVINFFAYFSDIGLAAALIQKKERLGQEELRTTFTIQQILTGTLVIIIFAATPAIKSWYNLSDASVYLLWSLAFSLVLSSLKTIPSVILERHLQFKRLVIPQVIETLVFYGVSVYLASRGFGITSFTIAVLLRGLLGLMVMYFLQPWMPGLSFSPQPLKGLLRFGLPYQTNTFLAMVKDDGLNVVLGGILGATGFGLLAWAQKWAFSPLRFFMDQVIKVTFPAFSRMQDDKEALSRALSRSIFFICLLVFPSLVGLVILAPVLVEIIPKYQKWQPALLALGLFGINASWAAVTTPLTNTLNAVGKIKITFGLMVFWTILTWLLLPALAILAGVNGVAAGFAIVGTSSIFAILIALRYVQFDWISSILKPLSAAFLMGLVLTALVKILPVSLFGAIILVIIGLCSYSFFIFLLVGKGLREDIKTTLHILVRK